MYYETEPHQHLGRLSKRELAIHLATPHRRKSGNWSYVAPPISAIQRWSRQELDRTHAEFHDQEG